MVPDTNALLNQQQQVPQVGHGGHGESLMLNFPQQSHMWIQIVKNK